MATFTSSSPAPRKQGFAPDVPQGYDPNDPNAPRAKPFEWQKLKELPEDKRDEFLAKAEDFLASEGYEIKKPKGED